MFDSVLIGVDKARLWSRVADKYSDGKAKMSEVPASGPIFSSFILIF